MSHTALPSDRFARKRRFTEPDSYDPAFQPAIDAGYLTVEQAILRGSREELARTLAERHGLPVDQAEAVADNRKSILSARRHAGTRAADAQARVTSRRLPVAATVMILLALGAAGLALDGIHDHRTEQRELAHARQLVSRVRPAAAVQKAVPDSPAAVVESTSPVTFELTDRQALQRVLGPTPEATAAAVCDRLDLILLGIGDDEAPVFRSPHRRHGIAVDPRADRRIEIPLHRDRMTGRWAAGVDGTPLEQYLRLTAPPSDPRPGRTLQPSPTTLGGRKTGIEDARRS